MVSRSRPDQPERAIWRLLERIDRLETMVYGRSSSVTNGRTRFIGQESLIVIGSQLVSGVLRVIGRLKVEGLGIFEVLGLIQLTGRMQVDADGEIVIGNVVIKNGKITVGAGASQIVIDGATGKILAGGMTIDPTDGGKIALPGGATVQGGDGGGVLIRDGSNQIIVSASGIRLYRDGVGIRIDAVGIALTSVESISGTGTYPGTLIRDAFGRFRESDGT